MSSSASAGVICDGIDDLLRMGTVAPTTFISTSAGTMMAWVKPTGSAPVGAVYAGHAIITNQFRDFGLYRTNIGSGDQFHAYLFSGSAFLASGSVTTDSWTHLAWVNTGTTLLLYKDGVQVATNTGGTPDNVSDASKPLQLCQGDTEGHAEYVGTVANVMMFNTALSAEQIAAFGQSRLFYPGITAAPTGYWPMDDCADGASANGVGLTDRTSNAHPMTGAAGTNGTGVTCRASELLSYPWGAQ